MSLINDMLKDLEKRQAGEPYPQGVELNGIGWDPQPAGRRRRRRYVTLIAACVAAALIAAYSGYFRKPAPEDEGNGFAEQSTQTHDPAFTHVPVAASSSPSTGGTAADAAGSAAAPAPLDTAQTGAAAGTGTAARAAPMDTAAAMTSLPAPLPGAAAAPRAASEKALPPATAATDKADAGDKPAAAAVPTAVSAPVPTHTASTVPGAADAPAPVDQTVRIATVMPRTATGAPDSVSPRQEAGRLYRAALELINRGKLDKARDELSEALSLEPDHVASRRTLAELMIQAGQLDTAADFIDEGLSLDPDAPSLIELRARVYLMQGHNEQARALMEGHLPAVTHDLSYHALLAAVYQRLGDYDKAGALYRQLVAQQPKNGIWWLGLGLSMEAIGNYPEARHAYTKAQKTSALSPKLKRFIKEKLRNI